MSRSIAPCFERCLLRFVTVVAVCLALVTPAAAQESRSASPGYRMPPKAIAELIDAPVTPGASLSPNREWLLLLEVPSLPPIAEISQPELRLAGLRFNPRTNGPSPLVSYQKP